MNVEFSDSFEAPLPIGQSLCQRSAGFLKPQGIIPLFCFFSVIPLDGTVPAQITDTETIIENTHNSPVVEGLRQTEIQEQDLESTAGDE